MKLARGLKIVRSLPRSFICLSWFFSIDSRNSSSLILSSETLGMAEGSLIPAICRLRQSSSAFGRGRVMAVAVNDHWKVPPSDAVPLDRDEDTAGLDLALRPALLPALLPPHRSPERGRFAASSRRALFPIFRRLSSPPHCRLNLSARALLT